LKEGWRKSGSEMGRLWRNTIVSQAPVLTPIIPAPREDMCGSLKFDKAHILFRK
jgi:hypothetical protein